MLVAVFLLLAVMIHFVAVPRGIGMACLSNGTAAAGPTDGAQAVAEKRPAATAESSAKKWKGKAWTHLEPLGVETWNRCLLHVVTLHRYD